uniref:AAA family ATPase n=1 Tax=Salinarimonas rosea TaxID=552063 RepID=UPI00048F540F
MRILAIRGENLASLAESFEIDFAAAPLAAAGLFAITGETGAGKSTLLDALCLALYDEFPRVKAEGSNEQIPDGENSPLSATDPRTILRRGAGRGFAEVDFAARDGAVYRVRCELNRARGKATGALQKRGRALWKVLPEGGLDAVASGVVPVRQEVERLTDLTCDQFRRTVLLAQGDFDAFLRADARERAELLEKITGTEIYATLSRRAYERWRQTRAALDALEARRAGIGLLAPEDRAAREAEIAALTLRKAEESAAREAVDAALRRHEAIATATAKRDAAAAALTARREEADALAPERDRHAALERAEPLRAGREKRDDAARAAEEARSAGDAARGEDEVARTALAASEVAEADAKARADAAQAACEGFEPAWSRARTLDGRIADARADLAKRAGARDAAEAEATACASKAEAIAARLAAMEVDAEALEATLARDADLAPLATRFDELAEALEKRTGFVREAARLETERDGATATLERVARTLAALDEADAADAASRAACDARLASRDAALAALDLPQVQSRAQALEAADGIAARLVAAAKEASAAESSRDVADARREAAVAAWKAAREAERGAEAALAELATRTEEVERLGALADATASESARHLRAALVPGEPCPVCGAPHEPKPDAAPDAFVAAIRERRDALRAGQDAARAAGAQAKAAAQAAEAEGSRARDAIAVEAARLAAAETAFADAHAGW